MNGGSISSSELEKVPSSSLQNKLKLYSKNLQLSMVQSTPLIVDSSGNVIENLK